MVRTVNVIAALMATAGMVSMVSTPLLAEASRAATPATTLELLGAPMPQHGYAPSEVAAMVQTMKNMRLNVEKLRDLSKSMQHVQANLNLHAERQLALHAAMEKLSRKLSIRADLASLGVAIKKSPTRGGIMTTISVRGQERLRVVDAVSVVADDTEQPPAAGPAVHRDEYDDLEAEGAVSRDEGLAVAAAADAEGEAMYNDISSQNWGGEACAPVSGPAADEEESVDCWGEAFNAMLGAIGLRAQGQASTSAIQTAWTTFKGVIDARPAIGIAVTAMNVLIAAVSAEVIVTGVVAAALVYFTYELYECYYYPIYEPASVPARD